MHSFFVHFCSHRCFSCKNPDMMISSFNNSFSSWHGHSENMSTNKYLSLEPSECVHWSGITGQDNHISSTCKKSFHSFFCKFPNLISTSMSVRSIFSIHFENHRNIWELFPKNSHNHLSAESWVKKSNKHFIVLSSVTQIIHQVKGEYYQGFNVPDTSYEQHQLRVFTYNTVYL